MFIRVFILTFVDNFIGFSLYQKQVVCENECAKKEERGENEDEKEMKRRREKQIALRKRGRKEIQESQSCDGSIPFL